MPIPESEKRFPAFSQRLAVLALAFLPSMAMADPAEDYAAGAAAHSKGDVVTAMNALKRAADAGHAAAQALYGLILDQSDLNEEAVAYLRKSAEQADPDGQYNLAVMYIAGEGVERSPTEANRLFRAAAAQDHVHAINALAQAYLNGDADLNAADRNSPEASDFVHKAAESGYAPAIRALANAYAKGDLGIAPDPALAEEWGRKAADLRTAMNASKGDKK